jgi:hypothetical protein
MPDVGKYSELWCNGMADAISGMQACFLEMRSDMLYVSGAVEVATIHGCRRSSGASDVWGLLAARGVAPTTMGGLAGMRSTPTTPRRR